MSYEELGAIAELVGAIAVIGSVLYLAYQIKGEKEATLANTRQLRAGGVRDVTLVLAYSDALSKTLASIGEPGPTIKFLMDEYGLSREDASRVNAYNLATLRQFETNLLMPMEEEERDQIYAGIRVQMSGQMGSWWQSGKVMFTGSFVKTVESIMRGDT